MFKQMTNSELLAYQGNQIGGLDRQRRFVLQRLTEKLPCPNCGTQQSYVEAKGFTVDTFEVGKSLGDKCECTACHRGIMYTVPMMGDHHWTLVPVPVPA